MKYTYQYQNTAYSFDLTPSGKAYRAALGDKTVTVEIVRAEDGRLDIMIDGQPASASVSLDGAKRWVTLNGQTLLLTKALQTRNNTSHDEHSAGLLLSPMPGQVRALQTTPGQKVARGQTLLVIEAMKMEIKVAAPFDGTIKTVLVQVGQTVEKEQLLAEME